MITQLNHLRSYWVIHAVGLSDSFSLFFLEQRKRSEWCEAPFLLRQFSWISFPTFLFANLPRFIFSWTIVSDTEERILKQAKWPPLCFYGAQKAAGEVRVSRRGRSVGRFLLRWRWAVLYWDSYRNGQRRFAASVCREKKRNFSHWDFPLFLFSCFFSCRYGDSKLHRRRFPRRHLGGHS